MTTNNATNNAISDFGYQYTTFYFTSTQIMSLFTTPISLIPAPGANKAILIKEAIFSIIFNSVAYVGGGNVQLVYSGTSQLACSAISSTTIKATSNNAARTTLNNVVTPFTNSVNKGIDINNLTAAFTTGNSTLRVVIWWTVIDTV